MRLHVRAFGLACGILLGLGVFLATWWIMITKGVSQEITILGIFYKGYNISALGSFIGLVYGFVEGLLGGMLFAWLYDLCAAGMQRAKS